jgi:hypothetical protein
MAEREVLESLFRHAAVIVPEHLKPQLAYRHMVALADTFEGWAQDKRIGPERSAHLLGVAESMRTLAEEVGPSWNPPEPATVSIMGFLGRWMLKEPSPPPTLQLEKPNIPLRQDSVLASPLSLFRGWKLAISCSRCEETRLVEVSDVICFAKEMEPVRSVIGRFRCRNCGATPSSVELQERSTSTSARKVGLL